MAKVTTFVKDSYEELKKVQWPTRRERARLTLYVIGVSLLVGLFVAAADYAFKEMLGVLVK
jgi:preprotein translocase subunit SecE